EFLCKVGLNDRLTYDPAAGKTFLHPGRQAKICYDGAVLGFLGEIHPIVASNYGIKDRVYVAVIDMPQVVANANFVKKYTGIANFPASSRDVSLVVPKDVLAGQIEDVFAKEGGEYLESYELFDVYEGAQVLSGHKSLSYSLTFRAKDRNLSDDDVNPAMDRIIKALGELNVALRQ
ncbi:MAG: phenylalanine--tRNA ligase subunit beta, partial [Lachnospiraceae bacterium]|nr:phenylalanine--tRNA ligase subunit beta [Lachnospiraceae bacterium]